MRVLLVNMPWISLGRPAIGVSLLKAALAGRRHRVRHPYLNLQFAGRVGREFYVEAWPTRARATSRSSPANGCSPADLFGQQPDPMRTYEVLLGRFTTNWTATSASRGSWRLHARGADRFLDRPAWSASPWSTTTWSGVSSTFQQNLSEPGAGAPGQAAPPQIATVMGGGNCEGAMGKALHELFPCVDYVCSGEGDVIFPTLVKKLLAGESVLGLPGILARGGLTFFGDTTRTPTVRDMDALPVPDYDDYFEQLRPAPSADKLRPVLAFETARGCWWGREAPLHLLRLQRRQDWSSAASRVQRALDELDFLHGAVRRPPGPGGGQHPGHAVLRGLAAGAGRPAAAAQHLLRDEGEPHEGAAGADGAARASRPSSRASRA